MRTLSFIICCLLALTPGKTIAQTQYVFRVSFTDKKGTSGDIATPGTFLSARALARRTNQGIIVDTSDLPVSRPYVDTVLLLSNGVLHTTSRWLNNCTILVSDSSDIYKVRSKPYVKSVQYTAIFLIPLHVAVDQDGSRQSEEPAAHPWMRTTGSIAYYGDAYDQIKLANGDYLHDRGFRGKDKLIAVLDAGFQYVNTLPGFDSLRSSGRIADTYNFNVATADVYNSSAHGTQVLSTMAGILNGGYVGTAPDAAYALYLTENNDGEQPFEMDNLVAGMERADSIGADIITISLGYNTFEIGSLNADLSLSDIDGKSTIAARGANAATHKGILVVASAGNEGGTPWAKILTPGDADSALTCGSVDIDKLHAPTSGIGPNAAGIRKPDVCMLGAPGIVLNNGGTTSAVNGTSIATPELAGLAACLWQTNPKATPYQLRKAIRESAHIASAPNNELGCGVPDFGKASLSIVDTVPDSLAGIIVKPNPFKDQVTISVLGNGTGVYHWTLCDIQGRKVMSGSEQKTSRLLEWQLTLPTGQPSGLYFLRLQAEDDTRLIRLHKL